MPPKRYRSSFWWRRRPLIHGILARDQLDEDSIPFRYDYHPLKLQEEAHKENEDGAASSAGGPFLCAACGDPVLGSSYTCGAKPENECSEFILHEKCAELPLILNHPIHGKHPLILLSNIRDYCCDVCGKYRDGLHSYRCKECDFDVDIQCASNLSNIKYAEHSTHPHILIFREEQEKEKAVFCDGCGEPVVGPSYSCRRFGGCPYTLHKSCVELPLEIQQHPVHTEHTLMLSRDTEREFRCDACNQDCSLRFTYSCFQCDFNLHPKCANSDQNSLMKHYTHEHALMFKEEQEEEYIGPLVVCDGCQDPVLGPRYTCINTIRRHKCGFNLHKSCADLPREIQHPMHRQHPLFLLNVIQDIRVRCICNACKQLCRFRYSCSICYFNLDLKCASKWENIIGNESHKHQFTVLPKELADLRISFCNVCGEYWSGTVYYMCSICQLLVHKECASLPRHITIPGHQHRLKLTWFVEDIYPKEDQICKVCSKSIVKCRAVYFCHDHECCGYVAHAACAMIDYFREKELSHTNYDDVVNDKARKIEHFSHKHQLQIRHHRGVVRDDDRIITCEGCIRPITTTTKFFYGCIESCHFFLHKVCAELPKKMFLPLLHAHPFTLLQRAPSFDGVFQCYMCSIFSQGFAYSREERALADSVSKTVFYLDLECSIYWENKALKHDSHVHRLLLNIEWDDVNCSGCGTRSHPFFCFSCKRCNFHLCIPCVKLPLTAKHRYDDHPLKLTYASVKNELDEYYCEICEGTRDPTHWFYYCKDCDFDCHPHCILGRYPQVKLGSTYEHDAHGQHFVTLVDKSKSPIPNDKRDNILPCEKCKQLCLGLVFECKECNINFHRDGCCPATDLASSSKSPERS